MTVSMCIPRGTVVRQAKFWLDHAIVFTKFTRKKEISIKFIGMREDHVDLKTAKKVCLFGLNWAV